METGLDRDLMNFAQPRERRAVAALERDRGGAASHSPVRAEPDHQRVRLVVRRPVRLEHQLDPLLWDQLAGYAPDDRSARAGEPSQLPLHPARVRPGRRSPRGHRAPRRPDRRGRASPARRSTTAFPAPCRGPGRAARPPRATRRAWVAGGTRRPRRPAGRSGSSIPGTSSEQRASTSAVEADDGAHRPGPLTRRLAVPLLDPHRVLDVAAVDLRHVPTRAERPSADRGARDHVTGERDLGPCHAEAERSARRRSPEVGTEVVIEKVDEPADLVEPLVPVDDETGIRRADPRSEHHAAPGRARHVLRCRPRWPVGVDRSERVDPRGTARDAAPGTTAARRDRLRGSARPRAVATLDPEPSRRPPRATGGCASSDARRARSAVRRTTPLRCGLGGGRSVEVS